MSHPPSVLRRRRHPGRRLRCTWPE
jgi:hypothetical protein